MVKGEELIFDMVTLYAILLWLAYALAGITFLFELFALPVGDLPAFPSNRLLFDVVESNLQSCIDVQ